MIIIDSPAPRAGAWTYIHSLIHSFGLTRTRHAAVDLSTYRLSSSCLCGW